MSTNISSVHMSNSAGGRVSAAVRISLALTLSLLGTAAWADLGVNKSFNPISASINQPSTLTIDLINANSAAATGTSVTDTLPAGLVIASPPNVSTTCGGTLNASAGGPAVSLSGGTVPAAGSSVGKCTIKVDVVSSTPNGYMNTIPAGNVASSQGSNTQGAQATFTVVASAPVAGSKAFNPTVVHGYSTTRLTITLPNSNGVDLTGVSLTDTMPPHIMVAAAPNLATTCGPGTLSSTTTSISIAGGKILAGNTCTISADVTPDNPTVFYNNNNVGDPQNPVNNKIPAGSLTTDQGITNTAFSKTVTVQTGATVGKTFAPAQIPSGGQSLLKISINNYNNAVLSPLNLTDTFPAGMTIATTPTTNCPGATLSMTSNSVSIAGGSLPAAGSGAGPATCVINMQVTASNPGTAPIVLTNTIPAGTFGGQSYDVSGAQLTVGVASAVVNGSKSFSNGSVQTGVTTMTVTLNNLTTSALAITSFTDNLTTMGPGFTVAAAPAATTTCAGGVPSAVPGNASITMSSGTIPANSSCTLTVPIQVGPTASTQAYGVTNTIATGDVVTSQGSNSQPITGLVVINPALSVAKAFSPSTVFAGADAQLTITLTRAANAAALSGLAVTDTLPAGHVVSAAASATTTCVGGVVTASPGSGSVSLSGGSLAGGSNATSCTITVPITSPNTAGTATNTIPQGNARTNEGVTNVAPATATLTRIANVSLGKGFNPAVVALGGTSQLSIQILNNSAGAVSLANGALTDSLPAGMHVASPANASFTGSSCDATITATPGASTVQLSGASIGAGSVCLLHVDVVANAAGNFINTLPSGAFTSSQGSSNSNPVSATLTSNGTADLSVTKTDGVTTAPAGGTVTYVVTFSNAGPDDVVGAPITDTAPSGMTFANWMCAASAGGACPAVSGSGPLTGNVSIPKNGTVTFTVSAQIDPSAAGSITNTASIAAPGSVVDNNQNNNSASDTDTLTSSADLSITKTDGVPSIAAGSSVTYTIVVSNPGPSNVMGATVKDALPAALAAATWTCTGSMGGTCTASGSGDINDSANLPSGSSVTYTLTATVAAGASGTLVNTATVSAPAGVTDPSPSNNSATDTDTIRPGVGNVVDLAIAIDDFNTYVRGGSLLDFIIVVQNHGSADAHAAKVTYSIPSNFVGASWTCEPAGAATCTASGSGDINDTVEIPFNGSVLYHLSGSVLASPEMPLVQTVTVSASATQTDANLSDNTATDTDTVGIFANGFDSIRLGATRYAEISAQSESMGVVAISAEEIASSTLTAVPFLAAEITDSKSGRAADLHLRSNAGSTQARLSFRGSDGIWNVGSWTNVADSTSLFVGWSANSVDGSYVFNHVELHDDSQLISAMSASE
jgi:uncharacterized repeat protein (TIGR01451 family)